MEVNKDRHTDAAGRQNQAAKETEESKEHIIVEILEYMPNAVVSKTIIKKATGNVTITSFDENEGVAERNSPYDTYIQIVDGAAEVVINEKEYHLKVGDGIVIPANAPYCLNAHEKFKMLATVIKSAADE